MSNHMRIHTLTRSFASTALALTGIAMMAAGNAANDAPPAMMRSNPRVDEIRLEVNLYSVAATTVGGLSTGRISAYRMQNVEVAMPVMLRSTWCDTDFDKVAVRSWIDGGEIKVDAAQVFKRNADSAEGVFAFNTHTDRNGFAELRVQATYLVQRWDVTVDEGAAAAVTWPRTWPAGTSRFLAKEPGIDPSNTDIMQCAESASPGGSRAVTPFYAAKNAVTAILTRWKSMIGGSGERNADRSLRGIAFSTGAFGLSVGRGSQLELAAACVAAVRSVQIPARIVYGLSIDEKNGASSVVNFTFICEFYLPTIGWVPFDPMEMRSQGAASRGARGSIKGFANVSDLSDVLPLGLQITPVGYEKADRFAIWGWRGVTTANVDSENATTRIRLDTTSRGNGKTKSMPVPMVDPVP